MPFVAQITDTTLPGVADTGLGKGTVLLCNGDDSRPLTLDDYNRLITLVGEGLIVLTNDVHAPRSGWTPGAYGPIRPAAAAPAQPVTVVVDQATLTPAVQQAFNAALGSVKFSGTIGGSVSA